MGLEPKWEQLITNEDRMSVQPYGVCICDAFVFQICSATMG